MTKRFYLTVSFFITHLRSNISSANVHLRAEIQKFFKKSWSASSVRSCLIKISRECQLRILFHSVYTFPRMRSGDKLNPFNVHCSNEFKSYYASALSTGMRVPEPERFIKTD